MNTIKMPAPPPLVRAKRIGQSNNLAGSRTVAEPLPASSPSSGSRSSSGSDYEDGERDGTVMNVANAKAPAQALLQVKKRMPEEENSATPDVLVEEAIRALQRLQKMKPRA